MVNRRNFLNLVRERTPVLDPCWLHVNRSAMACRFEITLPMSEESGVAIATEALDEVDRVEAQLTVFRDNSEVSFINRCAASEPIRVEQSLFDLLVLCRELNRDTDGAFDITSGPLTRCWGFLKREGRFPQPAEIQKARTMVGNYKVLLDPEARTIGFTKPGVEINFGSIGKGYALDCVSPLIESRLRTALVNAGASSFRAIGSGEHGEGWRVGLRDPRSKHRRLGILRIRDCALSTSGSEEQSFDHAGVRYGHIIDPRSGWPANFVTTVTVVTGSAAVSDALATAFYVGGRELAERYCAAHSEVLVIMLESNAQSPVVIGANRQCDGPDF